MRRQFILLLLSLSFVGSLRAGEPLPLTVLTDRPYAYDTRSGDYVDAATLFPGGDRMAYLRFIRDNRGRTYAYHMSGILWQYTDNGQFRPLRLIAPEVMATISQERWSICQDSHGTTWISTFGAGLYAINNRTGLIEHYTTADGLPTNNLFCVMEDNSGEIWVGTEHGGVVHISPEDHSYRLFKPAPTRTDDRSNAIRLLYQDRRGHYFLGTRDGTLREYDSAWHQLSECRLPAGLPYAMAEDRAGNRYVGTKQGGLLVQTVDGGEQTYSLRSPENGGLPSNDIYGFLCDHDGRMWMACFGGGLVLCQPQSDGRLVFRRFDLGDSHLNRARTIIEDRTGRVYMGTDRGVLTFLPDELLTDPRRTELLHITAADGRVYDEVKVIYEDSYGRIWVGATGGGLNLLERDDGVGDYRFRHFGTAAGLLNSTVQAVCEDLEGYIWVSTESGLSRLDTESGRFENLITSSGRHTVIFNEMAVLHTAEGSLLWGSYDGFYTIDPNQLKLDLPSPSVVITSLGVDGSLARPGAPDSPLTESITTTQQLTLPYNRNNINLECVMMSYREPELNQYAYYLEGYEDDYNPASTAGVATYRNLPPGHYTFHVRGCNSYGVWNLRPTSLQIRVLPPWWRTWWAYALYAVAALIAVAVTVRVVRRMERLRMAVAVEQQLTEYKLRFFTNISHEFRTPLTIIRGVVDDLASHADPTVARQVTLLSKSSGRLMRLIDQLLEFRKVQNGKTELHLQPTVMDAFLRDIFLQFTDMARRRGMDYRFESRMDNHARVWIDRSKVDKMAYNLLSNAMRYTPDGGHILMRLEADASTDRLVLSVSDSGPGIPADQRDRLFRRFERVNYVAGGMGIGLHLTAELARAHHGSVTYATSEWGGACFTLTLPLSDTVYNEADKLGTTPQPAPALTTDPLPDDPTALLPTDAQVARPYKDYRLMAVDDDTDVLALIELQLGALFSLSTATNGVDALDRMRIEQPDLVICDVMMPQMDGIAFTRRVRADHDISHIPIILLTAYASEPDQLRGIQAEADAYVTKPFSLQYLTARVVKLIEQRERLHRRYAAEPGTMRPLISTTDWDRALMDKIQALVQANLGNADFRLEAHMGELGLGRTTFFNKLKALTGCTPGEYVRVERMKRAAELLRITQLNISEVGYQVGIDAPYYFSKCLKNQFGQSPTQYRKEPTA